LNNSQKENKKTFESQFISKTNQRMDKVKKHSTKDVISHETLYAIMDAPIILKFPFKLFFLSNTRALDEFEVNSYN
jgi:hypothetical protein